MIKDKFDRRLFLSNEFSRGSGWHKKEILACSHNAYRKDKLSIIDSQVFDRQDQSVALSKSDFATYILNQEEKFENVDHTSFKEIFDVIVQIIEDAKSRNKLNSDHNRESL